MKHTMTNLEEANEPSSSEFPILGNYALDSYFGNFVVESSLIPNDQQYEIHYKKICFKRLNVT
jgi:hypothetical protein